MILVIGGTGKTGREVVKQLAERRGTTRVLVRSDHPELRQLGVETVSGDLANASTVERALRGVDRLFLLTPPQPDEGAVKSAIIDIAKRAGVEYVTLLSGAGAGHASRISQARQHAAADDYLKDSGLAFTILQPYFFMQNFLNQAGALVSQGAIYGNFGSGKLAMVDTRDIAAVAAACLTERGEHEGRTYVITGGDAITHADAARILSAVLERTVDYVDLPSAQLVNAITSAGTPAWLAGDLAALGENIAAGDYARTTDIVERVAKRRPIGFEQFVRDHVVAFR